CAVEDPLVAATGRPLLEGRFDVHLGVGHRPAVDTGEVGEGGAAAAPHPGQAQVLDLMAAGAESDEPDQPLDEPAVVVLPDLVALNRVAPTPAATDFAPVPGGTGCRPAQ